MARLFRGLPSALLLLSVVVDERFVTTAEPEEHPRAVDERYVVITT